MLQRCMESMCLGLLAFFVLCPSTSHGGAIVLLDGETVATGSDLDNNPLVTPYGTITFVGTVLPQYDNALPAGNTFSTDNGAVPGTSGNTIEPAILSFDFDVLTATFLYGGNSGTVLVQALDASSQIVDQFFSFGSGGPVTLSGGGIRALRIEDTQSVLANIDNIELFIPEPSTISLAGLGLLGMGGCRRRRK